MRKPVFLCAHALVVLSWLGLVGCYAKVEVSDSSAEKAIAIDWVDPPCAEPGSEAGYIEGNGFGAKNVTITVGGIEAEVLAATGKDASFVVPEGLPAGTIEVVVMNPGGRLATIQWISCEVECDPVDCDDQNDCTADVCDLASGSCTHDLLPEGASCGVDGVCDAGACREQSWGTPVLISTMLNSSQIFGQRLAVDPDGNVTVVWRQSSDIWSNRYTPSGGWGAPVRIESDDRTAQSPQVTVDPNGNAIAVWWQFGIWSNRYTLSGGWETPVRIDGTHTDSVEQPQVAVDPNGNATAVWGQLDGSGRSIRSSRYTPSGGWGAPMLIESETGNFRGARVAVDPGGNAIVVWQDIANDRSVWSNRYTPSGGWGTAERIESETGITFSQEVAVDPNGNAIAVWSQRGSTRDSIWSNRYTPNAGWGTAAPIESNLGNAAGAQIAFDSDGNATAVWSQGDGSQNDTWSSRYTPSGGWGAPVRIETNPGYAGSGPVAVDASGNAITVWAQRDDGDGGRNKVWSNRYTPSGGWGTAVLVESEGSADGPQVAVDPDGNATAVWEKRDSAVPPTIWSNRFE